MNFGEIAVAEAEGCILAHSVQQNTLSFKKGRRLSAQDVAALTAAGLDKVWAARLGDTDIHEDEAAQKLANAIISANMRATKPFTGRVNLYAEGDGVLQVDAQVINEINSISEAITIATLPPWTAIRKGQMIATIKIIPFSASKDLLELACGKCEDTPLEVSPFKPKSAGLITTLLSHQKVSTLDKAQEVISQRIIDRHGIVSQTNQCTHTTKDLATALQSQLAEGVDILLVLGASAITDRGDIIPKAIENCGGRIIHYGMPVDPGNLLLLGEINGVPVIGLPGCARSPKLNGVDWILDRLCSGLNVTSKDIQAMGVGGLLTEMPGRPEPRERTEHNAQPAPRVEVRLVKKNIIALVLAAGQSSRMGTTNKLLLDIDGKPMIKRVVENIQASKVQDILVVTGHERRRIEKALAGMDVEFVQNDSFEKGLSTSLRSGLRMISPDWDGVLVCLGDMPNVNAKHIDRLIDAFNPEQGHAICVPTYQSKRGNPVLWASRFFDDMTKISGDTGAKHLIGENSEMVFEVDMDDDNAVMQDIDTPEAFEKYRNKIN